MMFFCICLLMYEETLEGYAKLHRDQGGDKREDGDITGSKTSPCMILFT